jgi:hypothetical protein
VTFFIGIFIDLVSSLYIYLSYFLMTLIMDSIFFLKPFLYEDLSNIFVFFYFLF